MTTAIPLSLWMKAINMGEEVNTKLQECCPSVSPDGKYLFFSKLISPRNDKIFREVAKIIDELKPVFNGALEMSVIFGMKRMKSLVFD